MYSVIYRTGGTHRCEWRKLFSEYQTLEQANANIERIERQGYKAIKIKTDKIKLIGMPIGWEPGLVDWENDKIIVDQYATLHIVA
jgi:hypothetical protein